METPHEAFRRSLSEAKDPIEAAKVIRERFGLSVAEAKDVWFQVTKGKSLAEIQAGLVEAVESTIQLQCELTAEHRQQFLTAFQTPAERAKATHALAARGAAALSLLRSILDGTSKNEWGVAHRNIGIVVDCALMTIGFLGPIAKPLEELVRSEAEAGHLYAEQALAAIRAEPSTFQVVDHFEITGRGVVVLGSILSGMFKVGMQATGAEGHAPLKIASIEFLRGDNPKASIGILFREHRGRQALHSQFPSGSRLVGKE